MRIRPVVADVLAALTCLVGSWSCGGNDSALDRAGNIGAAEIKPPKAASLTEHKWGGGDKDDEKGECSRTGARRGNYEDQDDECSPTGVQRRDYLLDVISTLPHYPGPAKLDIHRVSPVYKHGRCRGGDRRATQAVILLHGAQTEAVATFDLRYPDFEHPDYSLMERLARGGIETFAVNLLGYGLSTRGGTNPPAGLNDPCNASPDSLDKNGNLVRGDQSNFLVPNPLSQTCTSPDPFHFTNSEAAQEQLADVVTHVLKEVGVKQVSFFAWSRGGNVAALYTKLNPQNVKSWVLLASDFDPGNPPAPRPAKLPGLGALLAVANRAQSFMRWDDQLRAPYAEACPGEREPGILDAIWTSVRNRDPLGSSWGSLDKVTGGVRRSPSWDQWGTNKELVQTLTVPTLIATGLRDNVNPTAKEEALFDALGSASKVLVRIACATHQALWEGSDSLHWKGPHATLQDAAVEWITAGTFQRRENGTFTVDSAGCARADQGISQPTPEVERDREDEIDDD